MTESCTVNVVDESVSVDCHDDAAANDDSDCVIDESACASDTYERTRGLRLPQSSVPMTPRRRLTIIVLRLSCPFLSVFVILTVRRAVSIIVRPLLRTLTILLLGPLALTLL